jgi:hypothetical protein
LRILGGGVAPTGAIASENGENTATISDRDDAMLLLAHDICRAIFADGRARRFRHSTTIAANTARRDQKVISFMGSAAS